MVSPLSTILRQSRPHKTLNILLIVAHERYESNLARTGHNFYALQGQGFKEWVRDYAPIPKNYRLLDGSLGDNQVPPYVDIDLVISQHPDMHLRVAHKIARQIQVPLLSLWHTLPPQQYNTAEIRMIKRRIDTFQPFHSVFISDFNRDAWGFNKDPNSTVIHHGVDTDFWASDGEERKLHALSVVNDWVNRDYCCNFKQWNEAIRQNNLPFKVLGNTPGLSNAASSLEELRNAYSSSLIFVNTSNWSPVPSSLLEAMACGCAIVSVDTCMIPDIITNGKEGYLVKLGDVSGLKEKVISLLNNPEKAKKMGEAAREKITKSFGLDNFVSNWQKVLTDRFRYDKAGV